MCVSECVCVCLTEMTVWYIISGTRNCVSDVELADSIFVVAGNV